MINLFFVNEILSNKYSIEALDALSIFIVICGIYTIISKNPIVSILYLIGLFGGVSSYLILIGLSFIGLSYILIYVGAVSILFLFILMLINIRISELQNNTKNSLVLALIILIFFNYSVIQVLPYSSGVLSYSERDIVLSANVYENTNNQNLLSESFTTSGKNSDIYLTSSNDWNANLIDINNISNIGNIMYTSYNLWVIITAFILLLAMVGSIIITIKKQP